MALQRLPGLPVPAVVQIWLLLRRPYAFLDFGRRWLGPVHAFRFAGMEGVVCSGPTVVASVLGEQAGATDAGAAYRTLSPRVLDQFLLTLDGAPYRQARRAVMPAFNPHAAAALAGQAEAALAAALPPDRGRPCCLRDLAGRAAARFMTLALLGRPSVPGLDIEGDLGWLRPLTTRDLLRDLRGIRRGDRGLWEGRAGPFLRALRPQAEQGLDGEMGRRIDAGYARVAAEAPASGGQTDQVLGAWWVGVNTLASALQHAFAHAARHPEIAERIYREAAPVAPLGAGRVAPSLLAAFCMESLRATPTIPLFFRVARAPITLDGHVIRPGSLVAISIRTLHRDPRTFADPDRFRPERFLERAYSPTEFLPFGGGDRGCLATLVAPVAIQAMVQALVDRFRLDLASPRRNPVCLGNGVTVHRDPIPAYLRPR